MPAEIEQNRHVKNANKKPIPMVIGMGSLIKEIIYFNANLISFAAYRKTD